MTALHRRHAGSDAKLAIVRSDGNLFASNLGIPQNIAEAVEIGLRGTPACSTSERSTASGLP